MYGPFGNHVFRIIYHNGVADLHKPQIPFVPGSLASAELSNIMGRITEKWNGSFEVMAQF